MKFDISSMKTVFRWMFAWLAASILTFVFASIFHSQFVLLGLTDIYIDIPIGKWLGMTLSDILGLSLGYGSIIAVTLLLCFGICSLITRFWRQLSVWSYPVLGALAIALMLLAMQTLLNLTPIAGARTTLGFLFQCAAGLIGGFVFARMWFKLKN